MAAETFRQVESTAATVGGIGLVAYGLSRVEWAPVEAVGKKFLIKLGVIAAALPPAALIIAGALLYMYGRKRAAAGGHGGGHH